MLSRSRSSPGTGPKETRWLWDHPYFLDSSLSNMSLPLVCMPQMAIQGDYTKHSEIMDSDILVHMPALPYRNAYLDRLGIFLGPQFLSKGDDRNIHCIHLLDYMRIKSQCFFFPSLPTLPYPFRNATPNLFLSVPKQNVPGFPDCLCLY